ncbi:SusC/RagA family TonB-linked outer membrane protein [Halosquirtibacter laminarini]|uniref:SusC/RagA family TonB-linked outer membrane protein n=1 Tax=Halosquirtibacter laminarini TaxID=3374600 RepID=A0AC61NPV1_9BACT|nr:SusC/RagA family TonB-linked outer membrane protein [Prolixibacteraceae bacterium]
MKKNHQFQWLRKFSLVFALLMSVTTLFAQEKTLTGNVKSDQDGLPIPGATVMVKGTSIGTVTDFDGNYKLRIPAEHSNGTVIVQFIGLKSQEVAYSGQDVLNFVLEADTEQLDDVVVTALGIKREKKSLGYAAAEVGDEAYASAKDANVMSSLSGRLAGVQVSQTGQGAGSSSSVIIRGNANLSGSNQPLYVVDGVPIANNQFSNADDKDNGGIDSGNGLSGISADDIENISVLKGASATALYGTRAMNGVVLITTKSGKGSKGTQVEFNSNFTLDKARVYNNWQDVYGQGRYEQDGYGVAPSTMDEANDNTSMWGNSYANQSKYVDYQGQNSDYRFYDNENNFYENGTTWTNSVSVTNNGENSNIRFSYSNTSNDGLVPETTYERNAISLNGGAKAFDDKLELNAKMSYANEKSDASQIGNSAFNPTSQLMGVPNNVSLNQLQNYKDPVTGRPVGIGLNNNNPYWTLNEVENNYDKDRLISMVSAKFNFTDDLSAQVRYGSDLTYYNAEALYPIGTPYYENGKANMEKNKNIETNIDALVTYDKDFTEKFGLTVNLGTSRWDKEYEQIGINSDSFADPNLQVPNKGQNNTAYTGYSHQRINSIYATAQLRYNSFLYLDLSARNDYSSTLPEANNSYFYPSVSTSFVVSDAFELPEFISFAKLRGSWAQVGSDTDPYKLALQYGLDSNSHPGWGGAGIPSGSINSGEIPNANLKPSTMTSWEVGTEVKFFSNRLGVDFTYYNSLAVDQIVPVQVSDASGYNSALVNSGSIRNKGVEVQLYATPVQTKDVTWNTTLNFSFNKNEVVELAPDVDQLILMNGGGVSTIASPGYEYGTIIGTTYQRNEDGSIYLDQNGLPVASSDYSALGNGVHDIMFGWVNSVTYKGFTLNLVLDAKFGGDVYSSTEASAYSSGKHKATLERSEYVPGEVWYPSELNGKGTTADPQDFYGAVSSVDEQFIYDASYISVKELSVMYNLPSKWFTNINYIRGINLGVFGKNLGYIYKATDNIDPQAAYSISNGGGGIESGNMALPASFGFNLNIKF